MECEKLKKLYTRFCENDVKCDEKYTLNCAVAKEMRNKTCLKTVGLFMKQCNKYDSIDKKKCMYDEK